MGHGSIVIVTSNFECTSRGKECSGTVIKMILLLFSPHVIKHQRDLDATSATSEMQVDPAKTMMIVRLRKKSKDVDLSHQVIITLLIIIITIITIGVAIVYSSLSFSIADSL